MFLTDVISRIHALYPSEYNDAELIAWCEEVSAMLTVEDRYIFKSAVFTVPESGEILLPDGVAIEHIERVTAGDRVLDKTDLRLLCVSPVHVRGRGARVAVHTVPRPREVEIVWREPYRPVRTDRYKGTVNIDAQSSRVTLPYRLFRQGDLLNIELMPGKTNAVTKRFVPLLDARCEDGAYVYDLPRGSLDDADGEVDAVISREITDKTVCDAPFDSMYIDYIMAKLLTYQHDTDAANLHLAQFNAKLEAYRLWLVKHSPSGECDFKNYW